LLSQKKNIIEKVSHSYYALWKKNERENYKKFNKSFKNVRPTIIEITPQPSSEEDNLL
jgi:hypothetical protein